MNCPPEHSGCWYCMTDFDSPKGWFTSCEFDCVLHAECLIYEHNEHRDAPYYVDGNYDELDIFLREFGYVLI